MNVREYYVEVTSVTVHRGFVEAESEEAARRVAGATYDVNSLEVGDPDLDDVNWEWPTPMDDIAAWVSYCKAVTPEYVGKE